MNRHHLEYLFQRTFPFAIFIHAYALLRIWTPMGATFAIAGNLGGRV